MKCSICEEDVEKSMACYGDRGTVYEGKPLCDICYYESEPSATVFYRMDKRPHTMRAPG